MDSRRTTRLAARILLAAGAILLGLVLYAVLNPPCRSQGCPYTNIPCMCPGASDYVLALVFGLFAGGALVASLILTLFARIR